MLGWPAELRGRFRFVLMYFGLLNFAVFASLAAFGTAAPSARALAVVSLLASAVVVAGSFLRDGPGLLDDVAIPALLGISAFGFNKVGMVGSLLFSWLSWVQLYGSPWRALLRLGMGPRVKATSSSV